jgi:hypothetical protein
MLNLGFGAAGQLGAGFDPSTISTFMDPFQQNVVGGVQSAFDRLRGQASIGAGQEATAAGAFGGSRQAILEAERLRNLDQQEAQQIAGVQSQGFGQALQAALGQHQMGQQAAQFGLSNVLQGLNLGARTDIAAGQAGLQGAEMLRHLQQQAGTNPFQQQMMALQALNLGMGAPGSSQVTSGGGPNALGQAAGGALAGFGVGGPVGGIIGGVGGLLGGLF